VAAVDWASLRRESGTFVDPELALRHSDLLFAANMTGGQALLYLRLEHPSSSDKDMPLRMLVYLARILERHRKEQPATPLPIILPVVISHAPGGWTGGRSLHELFQPDPTSIPGLAALVPDVSLLVEDLQHWNDDELRERAAGTYPALALWALRDARDPVRFLDGLVRWAAALEATLAAPSGSEALAHLFRYVALVTDDVPLQTFRAKLRQLAPTTEQAVMTIAEQMKREGREQGLQQGRAEGSAAALLKQVRLKFPGAGPEVAERISRATPAELDRWVERILTAVSPDELFES